MIVGTLVEKAGHKLLHQVHAGKAKYLTQDAEKSFSKIFGTAVHDGLKGNLLNLPLIAYSIGTAKRGEALGEAVGQTTGLFTYPVLTGIAALGLAMIPGVNIAAAGLIGSLVAAYPNGLLQNSVTRRVNWMTQTGKNIRHLEVGGNYVDSDFNKQNRQLSMMELSSAIAPARRFMGQEALHYHR